MRWYDILFNVLIFITLAVILIWILTEIGKNAWAMQLLKNQCIADCIKFNAEAVKQGLKEVCVC